METETETAGPPKRSHPNADARAGSSASRSSETRSRPVSGYYAERVFRPRLVKVSRQGRISTGLARADYFNWPFTMRQIVDSFDPDLVIVMLGENDHQSLQSVRGRRVARHRDDRMAARLPRSGPSDDADRDLRRGEGRVGRTAHPRQPRLREHSERQNDIFRFAAEHSTTSRTSTPGSASASPAAGTRRTSGKAGA